MAAPFLSSEEYDERAHRLYNDGDYDRALEVLKEGVDLYPHSVDLVVGLGYTRLAREEFAWARQAFERALGFEPDHEDALVGLGEVLLRLGRRDDTLRLFDCVRSGGSGNDLELLLSMGRALYREQLFDAAFGYFRTAVDLQPQSAEAAAAIGYTLHRSGDTAGAIKELRRALGLDPEHHEARVYLGHVLYDRGDWAGSLRQLERVAPADHWDTLALWRILELKRALGGLDADHPDLAPWETRLEELAQEVDPIDDLLADLERSVLEELEAVAPTASRLEVHRVRMPDGCIFAGDWLEIVRQIRDARGQPDETVAQFMRRSAAEQRARTGAGIPSDDPEAFVRASARAGLLRIEC